LKLSGLIHHRERRQKFPATKLLVVRAPRRKWTSGPVARSARCHSHLNYVVADTKEWEQSAAYYIDTNDHVEAFVKNAGLGFAIPYLHNGQMHDYVPDFIIRLKTDPTVHLILETKGYDPLEDVKRAAAERWVAAVNAEGTYGGWRYALVKRVTDIEGVLASIPEEAALVSSVAHEPATPLRLKVAETPSKYMSDRAFCETIALGHIWRPRADAVIRRSYSPHTHDVRVFASCTASSESPCSGVAD